MGVGSCLVARALLGEIFQATISSILRGFEGDGQIVGFATIACYPASETDYWIDDIMIDHRFQGRGYGRAAMLETLRRDNQALSVMRRRTADLLSREHARGQALSQPWIRSDRRRG